jgi:hypothetical protein
MKTILTSILFLVSFISRAQDTNDYLSYELFNKNRKNLNLTALKLSSDYQNFEYFFESRFKLKNSSSKEIKKSISEINNFIDMYYYEADNVVYCVLKTYKKPEIEQLYQSLHCNKTFPISNYSYVMPKTKFVYVDDIWISYLYLILYK